MGTIELDIRRSRLGWFYPPTYKPILDISLKILVISCAIAGSKTSLFRLIDEIAKAYEIPLVSSYWLSDLG